MNMGAMKAKIVQTVDYRSSKKTKHITQVIAKMDGKLTRKAVAKLFWVKAHAIRIMSKIYDRPLLQKWLTFKNHDLLSKSTSIVHALQDQVSASQKCINTQKPIQNPVKYLGWKVLRRSILDVWQGSDYTCGTWHNQNSIQHDWIYSLWCSMSKYLFNVDNKGTKSSFTNVDLVSLLLVLNKTYSQEIFSYE